jgi:chromosome segregation ATPase
LKRADGRFTNPNRESGTTRHLGARLDQECQALEERIEQYRSDLDELARSDIAVYRAELEQEARILHQERLRLQDLQIELQIALTDAKAELTALLDRDGRAEFDYQARKIEEFREKLRKYETANEKLGEKLQSARAKRSPELTPEGRALKEQIAEVERGIKRIDDRIEAAKVRHQEAMNALRQPIEKPHPLGTLL